MTPAKASAEQPDLTEIEYEQAKAELGEILASLESGGAPLGESVELWQRGEQLAKICQQWLDGAQAALEESDE